MTTREQQDSFLAGLLRKKASVLEIQAGAGKSMTSVVNEVDRQIKQCLTGGDPIKGRGVTKSGKWS